MVFGMSSAEMFEINSLKGCMVDSNLVIFTVQNHLTIETFLAWLSISNRIANNQFTYTHTAHNDKNIKS